MAGDQPLRPRILLDALLVHPEATGVGRSILELTSALAATDRGCDFVLAVTHPELFASLSDRPGWQVVPCRAARGGSLRKAVYTQLVLPRLTRRLRCDLVHSLQFVAPLAWGGPLVVTVHDLAFRRHPHTVEQPRRFYYERLVPRSLLRASRIVTNSRATAADVAALFPAVRERITPTLFGTPSWVWRQPTADNSLAQSPPFLFVGTLEPRKNLARLLEAYRQFLSRAEGDAARTPDLVLVGAPGWGDSSLAGLIRDLAARGKLRLAGYCQPAELWRHYRSSLALLFPSLHEGFGFPILEAMAAGLPVLTSEGGAMREVAGDAALLVRTDDVGAITEGLVRLAGDATLRGQLARRGPERARAFSWDQTAAATVEVYREVLAQAAATN